MLEIKTDSEKFYFLEILEEKFDFEKFYFLASKNFLRIQNKRTNSYE